MPFELAVALRYLMAKRDQRVIGFITVVAVAGIAAGVMALVIGLAVNNGFRHSLERALLGSTPHVLVLEKEPAEGIRGWRELKPRLASHEGVESVTPVLYGEVFLAGTLRSQGIILKGQPPESLQLPLKEGSLQQLLTPRGGQRGVWLGSKLAATLGLKTGNLVRLISPQGEMTALGVRASTFSLRVAGIFESGFFDVDNTYAFSTLENVQEILGIPGAVSGIELRLRDPFRAAEVAKQIESAVAPKLGATHWMEQNRQILGALQLEKKVSVITISLIQLVAVLNVLSVLAMSVMEKRRGIAVLLSLGASRPQIRRIFLLQGGLLAVAGIAVGLLSGYGLALLADHGQWFTLDEAVYSISYVPFQPRLLDATWISALALIAALCAAWIPARSAAATRPLELLRYE